MAVLCPVFSLLRRLLDYQWDPPGCLNTVAVMSYKNFRAIAAHINDGTCNHFVFLRHRFLHASSNAIRVQCCSYMHPFGDAIMDVYLQTHMMNGIRLIHHSRVWSITWIREYITPNRNELLALLVSRLLQISSPWDF
jgi:hypothetical protein